VPSGVESGLVSADVGALTVRYRDANPNVPLGVRTLLRQGPEEDRLKHFNGESL
jgi:hypothetical protein